MTVEKLIKDASLVQRQLVCRYGVYGKLYRNDDSIILCTEAFRATFSQAGYELCYDNKRVLFSAENSLAVKYVLCAILSEVYGVIKTIDPNKLIKQLESKQFVLEDEYKLMSLLKWVNIPSILIVDRVAGTYSLITEDAQIYLYKNMASLFTDAGARRQLEYPRSMNFEDSHDFAILHKVYKPKVVKPAEAKPKSTKFSFDFTVKACVPVTVEADSYADAVQAALKEISKKSLADVEYEIVDTARKEKHAE